MPVSIITNDRPPELFKSFVSDELSNFTVIVGLNGAGKSRLLQAIANTELTLTESQIVGNSNDPLHSIEFLDQSSFSAANFSKTEFEFGTNDKVFHDWRHETANEIVKLTKTETAGHESPTTSLAKTLINGEPRWNPNANALAKAMSSMNATPPKSSGANHNWNQCVGKSMHKILFGDDIEAAREFFRKESPTSIRQMSYQAVLKRYRDATITQELAELEKSKGNTPRSPVLSTDEFENVFGKNPFQIMDQLLETAELQYRVQNWKSEDYKNDKDFKFLDTRSGALISETEMSTGEKAILVLVSCLFNESGFWNTSKLPNTILLDEPDAFLHPRFIRSLMKLLEAKFVEEFGIKVIMTTHSPVTVSLAPPRSIMELSRINTGNEQKTRLSSISQKAAISLLNQGVPNLLVKNQRIRQVIVEADVDQKYLTSFYGQYEVWKQKEDNYNEEDDVKLVFISAGNEFGGGCTRVNRLVADFSDNTSILGLVDRDKEAKTADNVLVLGLGKRYALENYVYDPLLVLSFVCLAVPNLAESLNIPKTGKRFTPRVILDLDPSKRENIVKKLVQKILGDDLKNREKMVNYKYQGGICIPIYRDWDECNNKKLGSMVIDYFDGEYGKPPNLYQDKLLEEIIDNWRELIPKDIFDTFEALEQHAITRN